MKYRNSRTGAVIDAACEISGGNWEPVPEEGTGVHPTPEEGTGVHPTPEEGTGVQPTPEEGTGVQPTPEEGTGVQPDPARKSRKKSAAKAAEENKADNAGE